MRERFGATNPKALALRFHAQTGGSTLTAQQPENNIVRVADPGALGGLRRRAVACTRTASTRRSRCRRERAARIALRTQQMLAHEAGGTDTADPLGGSYFIEALTDELEERAWELIERVDELGGAVAAIEEGFVQGEIEDAAYALRAAVETRRAGRRRRQPLRRGGERGADRAAPPRSRGRAAPGRADARACAPSATRAAAERGARRGCARRRAGRTNLLPPMREALAARCTVGEICGALREEFGTYDAHHAP